MRSKSSIKEGPWPYEIAERKAYEASHENRVDMYVYASGDLFKITPDKPNRYEKHVRLEDADQQMGTLQRKAKPKEKVWKVKGIRI